MRLASTHSYIILYIISVLKKNASRYQKLISGIKTSRLMIAGSTLLSANVKTTAIIEIAQPFNKKELLAIRLIHA